MLIICSKGVLTQTNCSIIKWFTHVSVKLIEALFTVKTGGVVFAVITHSMAKGGIIVTANCMVMTLTCYGKKIETKKKAEFLTSKLQKLIKINQ